MDKGLLSLGSIVKLYGSPSYVMIIGYGPINQKTRKYYEYLGVNYPFGVAKDTNAIMFDNSQIEISIFVNYLDSKAEKYTKALYMLIEKNNAMEKRDQNGL